MTTIMIMISLMFMCLKHPLTLTIAIMIQTIIISLWTGMTWNCFWFSYIIFIIMMSGMLVIFIYMASIASNEKIKTSIKLLLIIPTTAIINKLSEHYLLFSYKNSSLTLQTLFSSINSMLIIIMVMYLFMTMMVVSKIVFINEGPLRTKS